MKKNTWIFMATLMTIVCIGVISCNKDKDNEEGDSNINGDNRIIGTWYSVHNDYTKGWLFMDNGTCSYDEWSSKTHYSERFFEIAQWNIQGNKLYICWQYDDGVDEYTFNYTISNDGKTLTLTKGDPGKSGTFTKQ